MKIHNFARMMDIHVYNKINFIYIFWSTESILLDVYLASKSPRILDVEIKEEQQLKKISIDRWSRKWVILIIAGFESKSNKQYL